jgi:cystathionine gamma-lyase
MARSGHDESWGFATRAIHAGQTPDPAYGAVTTSIYQTSTYAQEGVGHHKGYDYARSGNPTRTALEECLASLDGGTDAVAFASGMAAVSAIAYLLRAGDHVVVHDDCYGGAPRLFDHLIAPFGVRVAYVDATDPDNVRRALRPDTRLVLFETLTNPLLRVIDIAAVAARAHAVGALVVADSTFTSPYLARPLDLGADIVLHSATKYLGGHSDALLGALVVRDADLAGQLRFIQKSAGAAPGPLDAWLVLRGLKTLPVRMRQHEANARAGARFLLDHPAVARVIYPGLDDHPDHALASRQMPGFGGMISAELAGGIEAAHRVLGRTRLFTLAESFGGVESLIERPASMTHASIPAERRAAIGVGDGLIRLSVGIEDEADLLADLGQAFEGVGLAHSDPPRAEPRTLIGSAV